MATAIEYGSKSFQVAPGWALIVGVPAADNGGYFATVVAGTCKCKPEDPVLTPVAGDKVWVQSHPHLSTFAVEVLPNGQLVQLQTIKLILPR